MNTSVNCQLNLNIFDRALANWRSNLKYKMKHLNLIIALVLFTLNSCSVYNFTGTGKSMRQLVDFYLIEPGIDRTLTLNLQILFRTNLNLVKWWRFNL
jgi:hypothetical protein